MKYEIFFTSVTLLVFSLGVYAQTTPVISYEKQYQQELHSMPPVDKIPEMIPNLSEKEQLLVSHLIDAGLLNFSFYQGFFPPTMNIASLQYSFDCPPSQMRYILKQLYYTSSPTISDWCRPMIFRHMLACKDQTMIDLGREIVKQGVTNLSKEMLKALGKMNDPVVNGIFLEYLRDSTQSIATRQLVFYVLTNGLFQESQSEAQKLFTVLKEIAQNDKALGEKVENVLIAYSLRGQISLKDATLEVLLRNQGNDTLKRLQSDYDTYGVIPLAYYEDSPSFMIVDQFLHERGKAEDDFERYVILQYLDSHRLYWFSPESVEYVSTELAKLAPKFADKEKALAEAEAAYIAQYPDRAPVPIVK